MDDTTAVIELSNDAEKVTESQLKEGWNNYTDKQRLAILALLVCTSDKQAMQLAHISGRHFYRIKEQVKPHLEEIKKSITDQAYNILTGSVLKAAEVMNQALEAPSLSYRIKSAQDILDRTLGKPTQRAEIMSKGAVTVLNINATPEELEGLTHPLTPLDNETISK